MNKIILSVALSAITVSAPVLAQTGQYSTTPVVAKQVVANPVDTPVSTTLQATANQPVDISFAFKDGQNLQVKDMTQTEMEETQGAWVANAVGGGAGVLGSHFGYMGGVAITGEYNFGAHMGAVIFGGISGAINPAQGIGSAAATLGVGTAAGVGTAYLGSKFETIKVD